MKKSQYWSTLILFNAMLALSLYFKVHLMAIPLPESIPIYLGDWIALLNWIGVLPAVLAMLLAIWGESRYFILLGVIFLIETCVISAIINLLEYSGDSRYRLTILSFFQQAAVCASVLIILFFLKKLISTLTKRGESK